MLRRSVSGQYLYFSLVSAISGNAVTGASGNISGRKATDALSGLIVLSGNIIELGGGSYRANLFDWDCSGAFMGYFFSASGCVPVQYSLATLEGVSGGFWLASGNQVQVWSGTNVNVFSGNVVPLSGLTFIASGPFVNATATVASGSLYLASGSIFLNTFASGVIASSGGIATAWGNSGAVTIGQNLVSGTFVSVPIASISGTNAVVPIATISGVFGTASLNSGQFVLVSSGQLSGQQVDIRSGNQVQVWSGTFVNVFSGQVVPLSGLTWIASGAFVNATATVASGELYLASGSIFRNTFASGVLAASGGITTAWGSSGAATVGQDLVSGTFVSVPIASISGTNAVVPVATISGVFATASLNSGQFVLVSSGQLSGHIIDLLSGYSYIASGIFTKGSFTVASGELYLASGSIFRNTFASGVLAASGGITTAWGSSGAATVGQDLVSGTFVSVPIASISGVNAVVPVATISGVFGTASLNSGQFVLVSSGQLSGQQVNLLSGNQVQVWSGTFVNVFSGQVVPLSGLTFIASGAFVNATATVGSGTLYLASGSLFRDTFASGVLGASGGITTAWGNSGAVTVGQDLVSGTFVSVPIASISGTNAVVPAATISGVFGTASLNSGQFVLVSSGQLSGQKVDLLSGFSFTGSGIFAVATATVGSGTLYLASGSIFRDTFASGVMAASGGIGTAWGNSGAVSVGQDLVSGTFVTVPSASISGVFGTASLNSGQFVLVSSGQLSGQKVDLLSGFSFTGSGIFVVATATVGSGVLYLASGSIFRETYASGVLAGSGGIGTAWGNSGAVTVGQNLASGTFVSVPIASISGVFGTASLNSGQFVLVSSGQLSGQKVDLLSGFSFTGSGIFTVATATVGSGTLYLASGSIFRDTFASGVVAASGGLATAWGNSGATTIGQNLVSGTFVSVPIATISGTNAVVPIATISGVFGTASLNSGQFVLVSSGQLSGQQVNLLSGNQVQVWSGTFVNVFSGQVQLNSTQGTQLTAIYQTNVSKYGGSINDAAATTTAFNTTLTDANDFWNDALIVFTSGNLAGVSRAILDYANTNGRITVDEALPAAPDNGSTFIIRTDHIHPVSQIASAVSGILLASGSQVFLISGALSGQRVDLLSGNQVQIWSGTSVNVFSGTLVPLSGFTWLASGHPATLYSGQSVQLYSGQSTIASLVQDKSGYTLAPTGLDVIWASGPTGVASTWPQMVVQTWKRFFAKTTLTSTQLKTYLADGTTVSTTQTVSDDGTTQQQGAAT